MPHALKLLCSCDVIAKGDLGDDCKVLITKTCSQWNLEISFSGTRLINKDAAFQIETNDVITVT